MGSTTANPLLKAGHMQTCPDPPCHAQGKIRSLAMRSTNNNVDVKQQSIGEASPRFHLAVCSEGCSQHGLNEVVLQSFSWDIIKTVL
jgi:hypothetical protein